MAGLLNHNVSAARALQGAGTTPMADTNGTSGTSGTNSSNGTDNSSSADASSATISANDFLTLLVTEMQNQDPTADTDPNEYINQLVQVNSLEQLIDINQNLSTALGDSSTTGSASPQTSSATAGVSGARAAVATAQSGAVAHKANALTSALPQSSTTGNNSYAGSAPGLAIDKLAPGNLSVPDATPAALRVAQALNGRSQRQPVQSGQSIQSIAGGLSGTP